MVRLPSRRRLSKTEKIRDFLRIWGMPSQNQLKKFVWNFWATFDKSQPGYYATTTKLAKLFIIIIIILFIFLLNINYNSYKDYYTNNEQLTDANNTCN